MRWVLFGVCLVLYVAALALGYWIGTKKSKATAVGVIVVCLVLVVVRGVFRFFPTLEYTVFPWGDYAIIRPWWAFPFAMLLLGAGSQHMSTKNAGRGLLVFAAGILLVAGQRLFMTAMFEPETMTGEVRAGVCRQTTDYTCGAAAAATLLNHYGIKATEREMAELCWTNSMTGTDELCVARGLNLKLAGTDRTVRILDIGWDELVARKEPTMVTIHWSFMVDHWVVVFEASEDKVIVGDPLHGKQRYSKEEFLAKWRRVVVVADRT